MGIFLVIVITLLVITFGTLLTYPVIERLHLPARICAGAVIGLALLSWTGFLSSLLFGLNKISIGLTVLVFSIGLIILFRFVRVGKGSIDLELSKSDLIYIIAWTALLGWLLSRVVMFYPDGLRTAPANNFGDLPFHFSVITSFAYGENIPPQNPIFSGMKFTYPFLIDFLTAFFIRCGADWRAAFFVENIILSVSLVGLIKMMTMQLTGNLIASRIAPVIFFFNGGFGFINFFRDLKQFFDVPSLAKSGLISFLAHLPNTYTMNAELTLSSGSVPLRWGNVFTTLLIPQRSMLFGLPFVAMIVMLWWKGREETRRIYLLAAGLLAGLLPMLHAHGFFAVMIASVVMMLIFRSRDWVAFFVPVALLAGPQALWLGGTQVKNKLFELHWFWEAGKSDPAIFWGVNAGAFLLLLFVALVVPGFVDRRFYLPFLLWFIVPNVVLLAPWPWDNIKVLVYWSLVSCPLVAAVLAFLFTRREMVLRLLAAVLLITLTLSGALDVGRALSPAENVRLFGRDELEVAALLREKTPPRAVILHAPIHNSVVSLTGRQSVMGYPGHLWTHGIDYGQHESDVLAIYRGEPRTVNLLARLNVDYLIIGPVERAQLAVNENYFENLYPRIIDHAGYRVYRIK